MRPEILCGFWIQMWWSEYCCRNHFFSENRIRVRNPESSIEIVGTRKTSPFCWNAWNVKTSRTYSIDYREHSIIWGWHSPVSWLFNWSLAGWSFFAVVYSIVSFGKISPGKCFFVCILTSPGVSEKKILIF